MRKRWAVAVAVILIFLCGSCVFLFAGIQKQITIEAGDSVSLSDFSKNGGLFLEALTDLDEINLSAPGSYLVTLRCLWKQFDCSVVVVDTVAPKGQVKDLTAFFTQIPEPEDFLLASEDFTPLTISYGTPPNAAIEGTQTITICLTDLGGNVTELETDLTLVFDDAPPQIHNACDHRVYLGTVLDLTEGISVSDDLDKNAACPLMTML